MAGRKAKTAPETTEAPKRRGRPPKNAAEKATAVKTSKTVKQTGAAAAKKTKASAAKTTGRGRKKAAEAELLSGSQIVIECLKEQGVDTVFGYPGGTILNIYDELYKHSDEIHHVLTSHEQGAAHAADGYARATGKVGVCMATSGPGATNLVTGIATAYMDSVPLVAITANVTLPWLGKDTFQEVDIAGVTM